MSIRAAGVPREGICLAATEPPRGQSGYDSGMGLIITLLVAWLVLSILGFVIKGLLWLAVVGLVLFVATAVWGWLKRNA